MSSAAVNVRPAGKEEKPAVQAVFRQAFPLLQRPFFTWSDHVLVAEYGGAVVGAVILEFYPLPEQRKGGYVAWLFTAPQVRGLGAGQRLVEAALAFFDEQGCAEASALVEGYNTSSMKQFATRGFGLLSPGQQVQRYGWWLPVVWVKTFHMFDIGHYLWARPAAAAPDSPLMQWLGMLAANILAAWLALWGRGGFSRFDPAAFIAVPLLLALFFGLRTLLMQAAGRAQGLKLRYRAWESAVPLSFLISLIFRYFFTVPGGLYPHAPTYRYRTDAPKLGRAALAGIAPTLLLGWAAWAGLNIGSPQPAAAAWLEYALLIAQPLALFDTVMAFFPFVSFNGRRVWDWNRLVWLALSAAALALMVL
jgi:GNAT superfamily N-acetyltransferase